MLKNEKSKLHFCNLHRDKTQKFSELGFYNRFVKSLRLKNQAQMEIMGLAIIVILIGLGLLFAVQYSLRKPSQSVQIAKDSTLVNNFIYTLMLVQTDCDNRQIQELIQDCAIGRSIVCPGGTTPCQYVGQEIKKLLDAVLGKLNKKYDFQILGEIVNNKYEHPPEKLAQIKYSSVQSGIACKGEKESSAYPLSISIGGTTVYLKLDMCTKTK